MACPICLSENDTCNCLQKLAELIEKIFEACPEWQRLMLDMSRNRYFEEAQAKVIDPPPKKDPPSTPQPKALATAVGWSTKFDPLYGSYEERPVDDFRGSCFKCNTFISGLAVERRRGGTTWFAHSVCPVPTRPKKRKLS